MSNYEDGEEVEEEKKSEITLTPFVWEQIHHFHSNRDPWSLIHHQNDVVQTPHQHDVVFPPANHQNDVVPPTQVHPSDVVFPPVNHEDLEVREIELDRRATAPATPRRSSAAGEPVLRRRWNEVFRILGLRFSGIASLVCNFVASRGGVAWVYFSGGFAVAGPVALLWYYLRLRRARREESVGQLIRVIKEKDEKIHQLLYQIARMNELLLASHHGVPISGTASSSNHGKF